MCARRRGVVPMYLSMKPVQPLVGVWYVVSARQGAVSFDHNDARVLAMHGYVHLAPAR